MAGKLLSTLGLVGLVSFGCSRWSNKQSGNYVTVQADSSHDTERARKAYRSCREYMDRHAGSEKFDYAHVEKHLREALAADIRYGPAHHSLGVLYFWQNKLYLAAWEFEHAARLMPDRYEPLNNLGLVYESVGKYPQAKSFYLLAREKSPNNPEIIGNLARVSYRSGQSVDDMRPLLEDVLATDTRPEWHRWAAELLGLNVAASSANSANAIESVLPVPPETPPSVEELPLIAPPMPDAPTPLLDRGDLLAPQGYSFSPDPIIGLE